VILKLLYVKIFEMLTVEIVQCTMYAQANKEYPLQEDVEVITYNFDKVLL
jgi:hypothetical protein